MDGWFASEGEALGHRGGASGGQAPLPPSRCSPGVILAWFTKPRALGCRIWCGKLLHAVGGGSGQAEVPWCSIKKHTQKRVYWEAHTEESETRSKEDIFLLLNFKRSWPGRHGGRKDNGNERQPSGWGAATRLELDLGCMERWCQYSEQL